VGREKGESRRKFQMKRDEGKELEEREFQK